MAKTPGYAKKPFATSILLWVRTNLGLSLTPRVSCLDNAKVPSDLGGSDLLRI